MTYEKKGVSVRGYSQDGTEVLYFAATGAPDE